MQAYFWSGSAEYRVNRVLIILRCCHLGQGSARGLERVKSDPKEADDWLRNKGGGRGRALISCPPPPPPPTSPKPPSNTRTRFIIERSPMKNACTAGYKLPQVINCYLRENDYNEGVPTRFQRHKFPTHMTFAVCVFHGVKQLNLLWVELNFFATIVGFY